MSYAQLFRLDGRRAAVVGAGNGIGREAALALAAHGAEVLCFDRDDEALAATVDQVVANPIDQVVASPIDQSRAQGGGSASAHHLDVLDGAAIERAAEQAGEVDVLVFTAATNVRKRILDYTAEEFDRVVRLNLRASFDLVRAFGRGMVARGRGSIVGLSSIRATTVEPGQSVYAATKAGLEQFLRTAAAEFGPAGVRVNAIAPGVVETGLTEQITADPAWYEAYATKGALGRWAQPRELAGAVVFLASDAGSFVTGSVLTVDGGWTAVDGRFEPPP